MKKKLFIVGIIILLIILILGYILLFNNKKEDNNIDKKYYNLEDKEIIKDINKKINYISSKNSKLFNDGIIETFYFNDSFLNKLSNDDKSFIVLDSLLSENKFKNNCISYDVVNNRYNKLFGKDIDKNINLSNRDSISYKYKKNKYCINSIDKYDLDGFMYMYINKIKTNDDYIKVYVNYGMSGIVATTDKWILYNSLDNRIYKAGISQEEASEFRINKDNYSKFEEYVFLFKKKDNNYYFVKLLENY